MIAGALKTPLFDLVSLSLIASLIKQMNFQDFWKKKIETPHAKSSLLFLGHSCKVKMTTKRKDHMLCGPPPLSTEPGLFYL